MSQEMERSSELTPLWLLGRLAESGVALRLPPRSKMSPATWGCAADSPPRFPPCVFFHLRGTMGRDVQAGIHPHCAILPPSRRVGDLCDAVAVSNRQNGDAAGRALVLLGLVAAVFVFLTRVPKTSPPAANPLPPPSPGHSPGGGLDGFESPYLGHTGSWDGKGGAMGGWPKTKDLDKEIDMGLRWTFMPVYWRAFETELPRS